MKGTSLLTSYLLFFPFRRLCLGVSAFLLSAGLLAAGCGNLSKEAAQSRQPGSEGSQDPTPVDVAIARTGTVGEELEYTGTTAPVQEVSLRSQAEGRVLLLSVDVGDAVKQGQIIAQLDDTLLRNALNQANAELASLRSEVARAQNQVSNARALVESARLELQQAQSDSARQQRLVREGAIAEQIAEQSLTAARTATQALRAAQEQVQTEQQAVAAAQGQVTAQQAVVAQAREQLSYATLRSPIAGVITQRVTEVGNLVQPNGEILSIGDFSRVQVDVEVSELQRANIRVGQSVKVRLDAYPNQIFRGQVSRISPAAEPTARLIPIEVVIPNRNQQIGSGLLARASFEEEEQERVLVPEAAISQLGGSGGAEGAGGGGGAEGAGGAGEVQQNRQGTVFVVTGGEDGTQATVTARTVMLGEQANDKVEILSGLKPGERFVARSGKPLKNSETVRVSILSKPDQQGEQQ